MSYPLRGRYTVRTTVLTVLQKCPALSHASCFPSVAPRIWGHWIGSRGVLYTMCIMYRVIVSIALLCIPFVSYAHVPLVVEQTSLHDIGAIADPELSQAFYGAMDGFPHTYEIRATEPFHLFAEVLVPDIATSKNTVSGIIIKETGQGGRVSEVARLHAKAATWESFYEPFGGDSYRRGSSYEADVQPGVYRIEVSTPDNDTKYVLVVGKREGSGGVGYFETLGRIAEVKAFFGKSPVRIIESMYVYVPIVIALVLLLAYWYLWRYRRRAQGSA